MNNRQHSSAPTPQAIAVELVDVLDALNLAEKLMAAVSCLAALGTKDMVDAVNGAAMSEISAAKADILRLREKLGVGK